MTIAELMASIEGQSFGHQVTAVRRFTAVPGNVSFVGLPGNPQNEPDLERLLYPWLRVNKNRLLALRNHFGYQATASAAEIDAWLATRPELA